MVEPGMYCTELKNITAMQGERAYYTIAQLHNQIVTCGKTTHSDFIYVGYWYIGPSEVSQW